MIDERAYELLCCQLGLANEEKAGLRKQVNELIARLKAIEESNKENSKAMVDTINDLKESLEKQSSTVEHYRKEMELMRKQLEAKDEVKFQVVALGGENGLKIGTPYVEGASVTGKVLKNGKGKKITVFTYRPKKGSKRKMGHRQPYTKVEISAINA